MGFCPYSIAFLSNFFLLWIIPLWLLLCHLSVLTILTLHVAFLTLGLCLLPHLPSSLSCARAQTVPWVLLCVSVRATLFKSLFTETGLWMNSVPMRRYLMILTKIVWSTITDYTFWSSWLLPAQLVCIWLYANKVNCIKICKNFTVFNPNTKFHWKFCPRHRQHVLLFQKCLWCL